jgi:hypothetical protein
MRKKFAGKMTEKTKKVSTRGTGPEERFGAYLCLGSSQMESGCHGGVIEKSISL